MKNWFKESYYLQLVNKCISIIKKIVWDFNSKTKTTWKITLTHKKIQNPSSSQYFVCFSQIGQCEIDRLSRLATELWKWDCAEKMYAFKSKVASQRESQKLKSVFVTCHVVYRTSYSSWVLLCYLQTSCLKGQVQQPSSFDFWTQPICFCYLFMNV